MTKLRAVDYQVPIATCAASHIEFVVRANAATNANGHGGVDIFAHTWNPPVGRFFDAEYGKHLRASLHEPLEFFDKEKPRSQALSVGRAARLMGEHEAANAALLEEMQTKLREAAMKMEAVQQAAQAEIDAMREKLRLAEERAVRQREAHDELARKLKDSPAC